MWQKSRPPVLPNGGTIQEKRESDTPTFASGLEKERSAKKRLNQKGPMGGKGNESAVPVSSNVATKSGGKRAREKRTRPAVTTYSYKREGGRKDRRAGSGWLGNVLSVSKEKGGGVQGPRRIGLTAQRKNALQREEKKENRKGGIALMAPASHHQGNLSIPILRLSDDVRE